MSLAYITHPACLDFDPGDPHPELPGRISAINDHLISLRLMNLLTPIEAPEATDAQLLRAHEASYIEMLSACEPDTGTVQLDEDTWLAPGAVRAAHHAAGAAVHAVDLVMRREVNKAFCAIRPPGHHAEPNRAMGFCLFNNIAVAALHAIDEHGLKRVAIVDFDAHWGNGTDAILAKEKRAAVFATFQEHLFPQEQPPEVPGRIFNFAIAAHAQGREVRQLYHDALLPALNDYRPQLLLVSAGFDGHRDDAMSDLEMTEDDYAWITDQLVQIAERHANGRIVSVLEGGYDLSALGRSAAAHVRSLLEES